MKKLLSLLLAIAMVLSMTAAFAEKIGADAYTPDATTAAEVALQFCTK